MIEAKIQCLCTEYNFPLWGISLRKGEVVWINEGIAKSSEELAIAKRAHAVSVKYEERCAVSRPSIVPPYLKGRPKVPLFAAPPPIVSTVDHQDVANRTAEALRGMVQEEIRNALAGQAVPSVDHAAIGDTVRKAMASAMADMPRGTTGRAVSIVDGDVPVFIPSQITSTDTKSDIRVTTETTGSSSVEDTAALLKAARAGGRKPKNKEE